MASAYALCDLALCRAGGTTLAELTALGVPAVLVPLPIAANDHQRRNASLVAGAGAALILEQADFAAGRLAAILSACCGTRSASRACAPPASGSAARMRPATSRTGSRCVLAARANE